MQKMQKQESTMEETGSHPLIELQDDIRFLERGSISFKIYPVKSQIVEVSSH